MLAKKGRACAHFGNFVKWGKCRDSWQSSIGAVLTKTTTKQNPILLLSELKVLCVSKEYI